MSREDGMTGHLFEVEVVGCCRVRGSSYAPRREAMEQVRKNQPTVMPQTAMRLHQEVAKRFGKMGSAVKFYTAVRSPLDFFHGIDAFFEYGGHVVTVDLTMNPHKDSGKADVIITKDDLDNLAAVAARVAREFATQIRRGR